VKIRAKSVVVGALILMMGAVYATPANAASSDAAAPQYSSSSTAVVPVGPVRPHVAIPGDDVPPLVRNIESTDVKRTGNYEYICIGTSGASWALVSGEKLSDCHGSFLHKYINGALVANYRLAYGGGAATTWTWTEGCIITVALAGVALIEGPVGAVEWLSLSVATGYGLRECTA